MLICHEWKLIFLHVPKCSGTAIRQLLNEESPFGSTVSFFDFSYNYILKRYVDLAHLPLMDLRHYSEWSLLQEYHTLAALRHPYARLASACREYYKQKCRDTEIQMRTIPPTVEQLIAYLSALPAAFESHDLRYVHSFPMVWFTHYGSSPMVDTLLNCHDFANGLLSLQKLSILPQHVIDGLLKLSIGPERPNSPSLQSLESNPNLQAIANILYYEDFNTFGFLRQNVQATDPSIHEIISRSLTATNSHDIEHLGLAPKVRWYWGRDSNRIPPAMAMTRREYLMSR